MRALDQAVEGRDAEGLEEAAHKLKGAICNLAWDASYYTAQYLETMGREKNWDEVDATLAILKTEIERFERILKAIAPP
jgi:HPt (histidine-containing phosphotransfer) domain-containing protein